MLVKLRSKVASNAPNKTSPVVYKSPVSTEVDALRTVFTPSLVTVCTIYMKGLAAVFIFALNIGRNFRMMDGERDGGEEE